MSDTPLYRDANQPIEVRIDDLLGRMTLDEKLAQLGSMWTTAVIDDDFNFSDEKARANIPHGIGHLTRPAGSTRQHPPAVRRMTNAIQRFAIEETRLGVPVIFHEESCAGYLARGATTFPQAIGIAASWDPDSVQAAGAVIRREMRAAGAHHTLAPVVDINRDPRWGRVEETFGEDPYLIARLGVAYVKGVQGEDTTQGIACTGKHFAGYGHTEGGLNWSPTQVTEREFREKFLLPFRALVEEAGILSMMNSYSEIDGIPAGANKWLLTDILRGEWGFAGAVISDYSTLPALLTYHHVAADEQESAAMALLAGLDIELPRNIFYGEHLRPAIEDGRIPMEVVDTSTRRALWVKFRLGLFDNPYADESIDLDTVFNTTESQQLSLDIARKTMTLLKNDGDLLPLDPALPSIAVIGPHADDIRLMQGDYHYPAHMERVFLASAADEVDPNPLEVPVPPGETIYDHFNPSVSVLDGIKAAVADGTTITYAKGCDVTGEDTTGFDEAVQAARNAGVAVVVVGDKSGLTHQATVGEAVDRATLDLPGVQQQLVEAIHATGTPVVVVLVHGRPFTLGWIDAHVPAVLDAWLPAQAGGTAVADVLFGKVNPGGKLPVSFPRHVGQVPVYYNHKPSGGRSHWYGPYVDMPTTPLYPFGHGLSYTTFAYSDLSIDRAEAGAADTVTIRATITNTGDRSGDEVVQLYLHDVIASVTRPVKELKGFARVTLDPGTAKTVTFQVPVSSLGFYNVDMDFVVEPGTIAVMVGASSVDIRLEGAFTITGPVTPVTQTYKTAVTVE